VGRWNCVGSIFRLGAMLCKDGDNFGALPPEATETWALGKNIPFLIGLDIIKALQGGARS
jgi:hypothetical protein